MNKILKKSLFAIVLFMLTCIVSSPISQAKTIFVSKENFPDKKLRNKIKKYDKNRNGRLERSEHKKIKKLAIYTNKDVNVNIKGISKCKELKELTIWADGTVKNLDEISKVRKLENLKLSGTMNLKRIKVKKMKKLKKLSIEYCKNADEIIVTDNDKLSKLNIEQCKNIEKITVKRNHKLLYFTAEENVGTKVANVINNHILKNVLFNENRDMETINLLRAKNLKKIEIFGGKKKLSRFKYEKMNKLKEFVICKTALEDIEEEKIPNITTLYYGSNNFEVLNFSLLTNLENLDIFNTRIGELDITMLKNLKTFRCTNAKLEKIQFFEKNVINRICLNNNLLSGVWDLNMFPNLGHFECKDNKIEKIITNNHKKIFTIYCDNNNLQELNANDTDLYYLSCTQNPNVALYLPGKPAADMWYTYDKTAKVTYQYE